MRLYKRIACLGMMMALLATTAVYGQQATEQKPYEQELVMVNGQLRTGNVVGAVESLDKIIARYPAAADLHYTKALLFGQAGNFQVAIPVAEKAYELEPTNPLYANYLIDLYKGSNNLADALRVLDKVIAEYPENAALLREKMMLLHASKQSDLALQLYDQAVDTFGVSDTLDVIKGEVLADLGRNDEVQEVLLPWAKKNSGIRQVYSTLAYVYIGMKDVKSAISILEKGVKNTNDDLLYLDLADAYVNSNRDKQAFASLLKAFKSDSVDYRDKHRVMFTILGGAAKFSLPQMQALANTLVLQHPRIADSHVAKGDVLWRNGSMQEARSLFLTAVGINPNHVDAWRMLMNVELAMNLPDDAIKHGFEALELNPNNVMLLYFTGIAYVVKDDMENARAILEKALDASTAENTYLQSLIYAGLGDVYHKLDMASVSDVAYEEAIKLDSTNATAMNNYAYYLSVRNEKLDIAAQMSKQSNELNPNSDTFQDTYAWVLFKQEKYAEALLWIEKAVKGATNPSAVVLEHYGDILFKTGNSKEAIRQWSRALATGDDKDVDVDKLKSKITNKTYLD